MQSTKGRQERRSTSIQRAAANTPETLTKHNRSLPGTTQQEEAKHDRLKRTTLDPSADADFQFDVTLKQSQYLHNREREHSQGKAGRGRSATTTSNAAEETGQGEVLDEQNEETTGEGGVGDDEGASYEASGARTVKVGRWSQKKKRNPDAFDINLHRRGKSAGDPEGPERRKRHSRRSPGKLVPLYQLRHHGTSVERNKNPPPQNGKGGHKHCARTPGALEGETYRVSPTFRR